MPAVNDTPGRVGPPIEPPPASVREYFLDWLERDGYPFWPFWENVRSWWAIRDLPNLLLLHFEELKADMPGEIRRIADFLEVPIDRDAWPAILEHCSFDYMKAHATKIVPLGGAFWDGGARDLHPQGHQRPLEGSIDRSRLPQLRGDRAARAGRGMCALAGDGRRTLLSAQTRQSGESSPSPCGRGLGGGVQTNIGRAKSPLPQPPPAGAERESLPISTHLLTHMGEGPARQGSWASSNRAHAASCPERPALRSRPPSAVASKAPVPA